MKNDYRWELAGLPFMPEGRVFKGDICIVRLTYQDQNEKLIIERLAGITRLLASTERKHKV